VSPVIAVLGFGEAGSLIARDLVAAGATVRGFDPKVAAPAGVTGASSDAEAVAGADLVLSVNSAHDAAGALEASLDALGAGASWADMNTAAPGVKQGLAQIAAARGIPVADIAIMAPVPGKGLRVPMLASGDAADRVAVTLRGYGADIQVLAGPAGLAATRKLLRSVFYKGMAASIVEALEAARAAGLEDWLTEHIAEEFAKQDALMLPRIVAGTRQHAVRRGHEMAAAAEMLTDLGVQPIMAAASRALHERLAAEPHEPEPDVDSGSLPTLDCEQRSAISAS
jgi:3-hydroxyisobutyrate dehydrogenase-like beta-hydroxyacid dehydrogenase